jgi:acyl carrier protein
VTLEQVFATALSIDLARVRDDLKYGSTAEWDSLSHMALVAAIEKNYGIMLDVDDVIDMSSVEKAREILRKYGVHG